MDEELPEEMTNRGGARGLRDGSAPMETGKLPGKRPGRGVAQVARAAGLNRLRLPCGFRVVAAPSDLVSGQWRGSSCAARPINGPWAGHSGARCADLVVEGISSGEGVSSAGGRAPLTVRGSDHPQVCLCPGVRSSTYLPCRPASYVNPAGSQE